MQRPFTSAKLVTVAENVAALAALRFLSEGIRNRSAVEPALILVHGPTGAGKSHLIADFLREIAVGDVVITCTQADEWRGFQTEEAERFFQSAADSDVVIVEDIHRLPDRYAALLATQLDEWRRLGIKVVMSSLVAPAKLPFPSFLTSRLAAGLSVHVGPLSFSSRCQVIVRKAAERKLVLDEKEQLALARRCRSAREIEGELARLELAWRTQAASAGTEQAAETNDATLVEQIIALVGRHFRVPCDILRSPARDRRVVRARQVGMYLARQLTGLSLSNIGARFGGRDHATVLHACRKVQRDIRDDPQLNGVVEDMAGTLA
ncbi:MAG: hypothetical protein KatS3mg105_2460 [Gemmatales bacterium]|nr:MAG: hypothetical protein KatS3mg105_2460 [Gemmatales bacterium]